MSDNTAPPNADGTGESMTDLRRVLFQTIRAVRSGECNLDQARTINDLAKTLTDTAKVEVEYIKANNGGESDFLDGTVGEGNLPPGITGIRQHRLK